MSEQQVPASVAQRVIIKFLTKKGVKPCAILTGLKVQYGDDTLSKTQVFDWAKKFKSGRESVENVSHNRRPRSSVSVTTLEFVRNWLVTQPQSFYEQGINKLPNRWEKCVEREGDYVEK
ncbi:GVQW3 protein, partial [Pseudoatta argentina]